MSDPLSTIAKAPPTQLSTLLRYLLLGGGAFGALRLGSDIAQAQQLDGSKAKDKSTLVIDLPENINPHLMAQKQAGEKVALAWDFLKKLLAEYAMPAIPFAGGFMGSKMLYDAYQKNKLKKEIADANTEYMRTLSNFKQASEKVSTPNVDQFCEAAVAELGKQAGWKLPAGLLASGVAATKALEGYRGMDGTQDKLDEIAKNTTAGLQSKGLSYNDIPGADLSKTSFGIGLGSVGLMGLYLLLKAQMKKNEKEQKRILPSSVAINYKPAGV